MDFRQTDFWHSTVIMHENIFLIKDLYLGKLIKTDIILKALVSVNRLLSEEQTFQMHEAYFDCVIEILKEQPSVDKELGLYYHQVVQEENDVD